MRHEREDEARRTWAKWVDSGGRPRLVKDREVRLARVWGRCGEVGREWERKVVEARERERSAVRMERVLEWRDRGGVEELTHLLHRADA